MQGSLFLVSPEYEKVAGVLEDSGSRKWIETIGKAPKWGRNPDYTISGQPGSGV